jgi:TPP-dependent pyruvate/acetoin dehydrogenase alpha subunit
MTGHSAHDAAEYVPAELLEREAKKDPIPRFENLLLSRQILTKQRLSELEQTIQREIDDAVAFAEASPMPEGSTALEGVYCGPDCWWKKP